MVYNIDKYTNFILLHGFQREKFRNEKQIKKSEIERKRKFNISVISLSTDKATQCPGQSPRILRKAIKPER